jgi:hypothetical protein
VQLRPYPYVNVLFIFQHMGTVNEIRMCKVRLGKNLIDKLLITKRLVTLRMSFLQVFTVNFKLFYIHGSVHRNSELIRSNKMQQYAGIYLLQNHSICFGCPSHPSSGVHKTVAAASGTGHNIWVTTFLQRDLIRPCWRKVVAQML